MLDPCSSFLFVVLLYFSRVFPSFHLLLPPHNSSSMFFPQRYCRFFFPNFLPVKGVLVHPCTRLSLLPLSSRPSLFFLPSGDGNQLLGSLGDIVGALDDLLSEELVVHRGGPGLLRGSLTTLHLQPGGAGGQQAEGAVDRIQCWSLWTKKGGRKGGIKQQRGDASARHRECGTHFREERGHLSDSGVDLLRTRDKARQPRWAKSTHHGVLVSGF